MSSVRPRNKKTVTKKNGPLVSVIIPTYNYAHYLPKAIKSCLDQSYKNLEIIVIDDGSTDHTRELVKQFGNKVLYVYQDNSGVSTARNNGLDIASGEFIAFLDADDYLIEDSIEARLQILLDDGEIGFAFSETYSLDGENLVYKPDLRVDVISSRFYEDLLVRHLRFQTGAVMIRSALAKQFRFPVDLANGEDVAYFTKVFFSAKGYFLVKPLVVNVRHADSLRHDVEEIKRQGSALVDTIFNDPYYKGALDYLRVAFTSNRHLELFRRLYRSGEKALARRHYLRAVAVRPTSLFNIDYLVKFLKACLQLPGAS
jgi:glycosyltransferase involved in cell wall biosynthesis